MATTADAAMDAAIEHARRQPPARRVEGSEIERRREAFRGDQRVFSDSFDGAVFEHGGWYDIEGLGHAVRAAPWECVLERFVIFNGDEARREELIQRAIDASHLRFKVDYVTVDRRPCLYVWRKVPLYCRPVSHWNLSS